MQEIFVDYVEMQSDIHELGGNDSLRGESGPGTAALPTGVPGNAEAETWRCLDDGTNRNVLFISNKGTLTRIEPEGFQHEYFDNGERRYFYRKHCLRCKRVFTPSALSHSKGEKAYSVNICHMCCLVVSKVKTFRGNENKIWENVKHFPKLMMYDIQASYMDPNYEEIMNERTKEAKYGWLTVNKQRRDDYRMEDCKVRAEMFKVTKGVYRSYGFDLYDEYFGEVDKNDIPHGFGVRFYSDSSIYVGDWLNGTPSTEKKGTMNRPDGSMYEGTWLAGKKHGYGRQINADRTEYVGQFANGYAHGDGKLTMLDGSTFEGRFRYGRRDGPGTVTTLEGEVQRGVYHDPPIELEKSPPTVYNYDYVDENRVIYNPPSLTMICVSAVAKQLVARNPRLTTEILQTKLPNHVKPAVGVAYLKADTMISESFRVLASKFAFQEVESIRIAQVNLKLEEVEMLVYLTEANLSLHNLELYNNKLQSNAVEAIARAIERKRWLFIQRLEIHFNTVDIRGCQALFDATTLHSAMRVLKLVSCRLPPLSGIIIGEFLAKDNHLEEIDVAFNLLGPAGAEGIADGLERNTSLLILSVRMNDIQTAGGQALVRALRKNRTLKQLCIADNNVGADVMSELVSRLTVSVPNLMRSLRAAEIITPSYLLPENYAWKKKNKEGSSHH